MRQWFFENLAPPLLVLVCIGMLVGLIVYLVRNHLRRREDRLQRVSATAMKLHGRPPTADELRQGRVDGARAA